MINNERVLEILQYRKWTIERNVDAPTEWWEELTVIFSKNIKETIKYFDNCKEEDIAILIELFEDIAMKSQSKDFIKFIEKLEKQYPNIDMEQEIAWSKNAIED